MIQQMWTMWTCGHACGECPHSETERNLRNEVFPLHTHTYTTPLEAYTYADPMWTKLCPHVDIASKHPTMEGHTMIEIDTDGRIDACTKVQPTHRCSDPDHLERRKAWAREHARRKYATDPDAKSRQTEWRKANQDKVSEKNRSYFERNKELIIAQRRKYREVNRDATRAQRRAHREANPEVYWEYAATRRARRRAAFVESVPRTEVFDGDGWVCQIQGCLYPDDPVSLEVTQGDPRYATVDHIIPLARGGLHQRSNLQAAHRKCNQRKALKNEI